MSQNTKDDKQTLPTINHYGRIMNTGPETSPNSTSLKKYNKKLETNIANDQYQAKMAYEKGMEKMTSKLPEIKTSEHGSQLSRHETPMKS